MSSETRPLTELCSIKQGRYLAPHEMSELKSTSTPVPVIGGNGVLGYTNRASNTRDVVLVTCRGSRCGLLQWVSAPVWVSNNAIACDTGTDLGNQLLHYLLSGTDFQDVTTGSAQPQITIGHLSAKRFEVPPKHWWPGIVGMLSNVDDRIALLRETNATLEAIAQALFKSWFVDFDPVRAKQQGLAPAGMDEATAALFPGSFEESALGLVPKEWRCEPVGQIVEGIYDGPHATPPEADVGPVFLGIKNLTGSGLDLNDVRHIAEDDFAQWTRRVTPRPGDIVFSYEATLGFFALVPPGLRCCLGRRLALIRPHGTSNDGHFLLHQFISAPFQQMLERHTIHGATVNRIALKHFPSYLVLNPPEALKAAFDAIAAPLWARVHENQAQAQTLATLRDTLLPRLISGQLRLPEPEALVAAA